MAKHAHVSRYYADDKDIVDLVSQSSIKANQLAGFLRERGIIVSPLLSKDELVRYFRYLPLAWPDFDSLVARLDRPDRDEKKTFRNLTTSNVEMPKLLEILTTIKDDRGLHFAENHKSEVVGTDCVEVKVLFTETDPSKTRALQRRERNLTIRITKAGDTFKVQHDDNPRAQKIVDRIESELASVSTTPPTREVIDVSGLSSSQRDAFFTKMAKGLTGYDVDDVQDLKVERLDGLPADELAEDSEPAGDTIAGSEFEGIVKKAVLSGTGLLMSKDYVRYSREGFCISKMVWTVQESATVADIIELMAEFRGDNGTEFRYDVCGRYERDENGDVKKTRVPVRGAEKVRFLELLAASASTSLATLRLSSQETESTTEAA